MSITADNTRKTTDLTSIGRLHVQSILIDKEQRLRPSKRIFDVLFSSAALILIMPLLCIVALAVRLDSAGPVLFRQVRTGLNGKTFNIYKFRTLRVEEDGTSVREVARNDPRTTRLGRVLRKTSVDELPQLWNVLRGEMSLVGPRPHAVLHDEYFGQHVPGYWRRFEVQPGLTGWAQVNNARGSISELSEMIRRIELDLWYIENFSFRLDIYIILKTIYLELTGRSDAY